jgi:hypothetical protein
MKRSILVMMVAMMALGAMAADTVRVAAIQCPSVMGRTEDNLRNIAVLVRKAAAQGAKIIVTPECPTDSTWSRPIGPAQRPNMNGRGAAIVASSPAMARCLPCRRPSPETTSSWLI